MSIPNELVDEIARKVKESLQDDLVSAGELRYLVVDSMTDNIKVIDCMKLTILRLLTEGVEIGNALNVENRYTKFVAWRGIAAERCDRALREYESSTEMDRFSVFWLCLEANVDEYEPRVGL